VTESGMVDDDLIGDLHASAEYRRHLIAVMIRRGVAAALV
jgi:CO/xanthine dehydrogenase FAD-binding subunit